MCRGLWRRLLLREGWLLPVPIAGKLAQSLNSILSYRFLNLSRIDFGLVRETYLLKGSLLSVNEKSSKQARQRILQNCLRESSFDERRRLDHQS